jgi:hypothetical protein
MPVKLRFPNGTIAVIDDGRVTCPGNEPFADGLLASVDGAGAEQPDPDLYIAETLVKGMPWVVMFDYEPFNMARDPKPGKVY